MEQTTVDTAELAARLRLAVTRLARRLRQQAGSGLTPSMTAALASVERAGSPTIGALAAAEQVSAPTMSVVVGKLEEQGLVARETDAADRRVTRVRITAEGRRSLNRARTRKNAYLSRRLRALDPEDLAVLERAAEVLERLAAEDRP
ncbi:MAG TPA: MarR family transcriptional regulator [Acidimicrobiales bacterium]|jgi:DNA-binding MarR family transcriptional regulator